MSASIVVATPVPDVRTQSASHQRLLLALSLRSNVALRIAATIDDAWDEATAIDFVLTGLHDQLGYRAADVAWLTPDGAHLRVAHVGGEYRRVLKPGLLVEARGTPRGDVATTGRAHRIAEASADPRMRALVPGLPMQSQLLVPICAGDGRRGVLSVESDDAIPATDSSSLAIVADRIGRLCRAIAAREACAREVRRQVAHELHDSVVQSLSALRMLAETLPAITDTDAAAAQAKRVQFLAKQGLAELRAIVNACDPVDGARAGISMQSQAVLGSEQLRTTSFARTIETLGRGLVPAGVELTVSLATLSRRSLADELMLLRVCHEAVSNAVRHAGARRIAIETIGDSRDRLRIVDDGRGFDPAAIAGGTGLRSMRDRVRSLGGELEVRRGETGGTEVRIALPPARVAQAG